MSGRQLRPEDAPGNWVIEIQPFREAGAKEEGFHAAFFASRNIRDAYDGEGWGATVEEAARAAVQDANEEESTS